MFINFNICKILCFSDQDFEIVSDTIRDNIFVKCFNLKNDINEINNIINVNNKTPILIIGWNCVKKNFTNQSILNNKVTDIGMSDNLYWTYDFLEDKEKMLFDLSDFIKRNDKNFFNNVKYITHDFVLDGDFSVKENDLLNNKWNRIFIYFHKTGLYLYIPITNVIIGINLESAKYCGIDVKDFVTKILNKNRVFLFDSDNLFRYVNIDKINNRILTMQNLYRSVYNNIIDSEQLLEAFGNAKDCSLYIPYLMFMMMQNEKLNFVFIKSCLRQYEKDRIIHWLSNRPLFFDNGFKSDKKLLFKSYYNKKYTTLKYSDKRALTGRIFCNDVFNVQAIPKDSNDRKNIISGFNNGKIVTFDYVSFEAKISLYLSGNASFIDKYKNADLHAEVAKIIYNKETITDIERSVAKKTNNIILYGGGNDLVEKVLPDFINDKAATINAVKSFLKPILLKSKEVTDLFKKNGYIKSIKGTVIYPNKEYASFNNYIQSSAVEIIVDKLYELKFVQSKFKARFLFQNHDSFIMDFPSDEIKHIDFFVNLFSTYHNMSLPISYNIKDNLLK